MAIEFEARAYGPESTPEEIQAIKNCVYLYSPGVIMWRELPVQSVFHLDLFEAKLNELIAELTSYALLIDLTGAQPPAAAIRARLKKIFGVQRKMKRTAVFTGKNFMLNVAAKFVLGSAGLQSFTVHKTLEQALDALAAP